MFMQLITTHELIGSGVIQCTSWIFFWLTEVILRIGVVKTSDEILLSTHGPCVHLL